MQGVEFALFLVQAGDVIFLDQLVDHLDHVVETVVQFPHLTLFPGVDGDVQIAVFHVFHGLGQLHHRAHHRPGDHKGEQHAHQQRRPGGQKQDAAGLQVGGVHFLQGFQPHQIVVGGGKPPGKQAGVAVWLYIEAAQSAQLPQGIGIGQAPDGIIPDELFGGYIVEGGFHACLVAQIVQNALGQVLIVELHRYGAQNVGKIPVVVDDLGGPDVFIVAVVVGIPQKTAVQGLQGLDPFRTGIVRSGGFLQPQGVVYGQIGPVRGAGGDLDQQGQGAQGHDVEGQQRGKGFVPQQGLLGVDLGGAGAVGGQQFLQMLAGGQIQYVAVGKAHGVG